MTGLYSLHVARRAVEEIPPSIADTVLALPVVERARVLAWSLGQMTWRPVGDTPRWARRAQLELHRRLRQLGLADSGLMPRVRVP